MSLKQSRRSLPKKDPARKFRRRLWPKKLRTYLIQPAKRTRDAADAAAASATPEDVKKAKKSQVKVAGWGLLVQVVLCKIILLDWPAGSHP